MWKNPSIFCEIWSLPRNNVMESNKEWTPNISGKVFFPSKLGYLFAAVSGGPPIFHLIDEPGWNPFRRQKKLTHSWECIRGRLALYFWAAEGGLGMMGPTRRTFVFLLLSVGLTVRIPHSRILCIYFCMYGHGWIEWVIDWSIVSLFARVVTPNLSLEITTVGGCVFFLFE